MSRRTISVAEYHAAVARDMLERDLQQQVLDLASELGWARRYHTWNSRHSESGFPDLVLLRRERQIVAELKGEGRNPTVAQLGWLAAFSEIPGCEAFVWRPSDLLSGRIHGALS